MKHLFFRFCTLLISLLMVVSLCACGQDSGATTTASNADATTAADTTTAAVSEPTDGDAGSTDGATTATKEQQTTIADNDTVTTVNNTVTTTGAKDPWGGVTAPNKTTTATATKSTTATTTTTSKTSGKPAATTSTADNSTAVIARKYALKDVLDKINVWGRTGETKNSLFVDHVAAGIEFTAYIEGDVTLSIGQTSSGSMTSYYTVWIDGVRQEGRLKSTDRSPKPKTIASFSEGGVHTIRVLKQNELGVSVSIFKDLAFTGYLMDPPKKSDLYIEFLGDSITSGYGNMMYVAGVGDVNAAPVSAVNSDGTLTYAFLATEKLNARCTIISDSGIGVIYEHGSVAGRRMSNFWKYNSYARQDLGQFKPTEVPDIIVINLGTNDRMNGTPDSAMVTGVKDLISQLRTTYKKDVPIVWATGMMYGAKEDAVKKALKELGGEDSDLYYLALTPDGSGGGGHPGPESNEENADILVNFLKSKNLV